MTTPNQPGAKPCPSCGTAMSGPFCSNCGAGAGEVVCGSCRQTSRAGSRFCAHCGGTLGASGRRPVASGGKSPLATVAPWVLGGGLGIALIALLARQPGSEPTSQAATGTPAQTEAPPDLSSMTPRERFIRLYDRVITAAQSGDQATVERFTPMALAAYTMLEKIDADARYHLAMIQMHVGDLPGAQSQADTLIKTEPDHLFGYVIDAGVARFQNDEPRKKKAYEAILARYDKEMKTKKPEYAEHQAMLEQLLKSARGN